MKYILALIFLVSCNTYNAYYDYRIEQIEAINIDKHLDTVLSENDFIIYFYKSKFIEIKYGYDSLKKMTIKEIINYKIGDKKWKR